MIHPVALTVALGSLHALLGRAGLCLSPVETCLLAVLCKAALAPQEVDSRWLEYQSRVESLISWIKQHTILMSDKSFPQNPVELKVGPGRGPSPVSHVLGTRSWVVAFPQGGF